MTSKANPFPDLPDALTSKNGQRVTTASQWWDRRRPEIVEDFEREVLGRVPPDVPRVTWKITATANAKTGVFPVIEKQLVGHVENSSCPSITVEIQMTLVTPANAKGPVPVMMMFGSAAFLKRMADAFASRPELKKALGTDPPSTEQLIAGGWGYALIDPASIQPDNGAGLTKGIIGLTNKGQPRKPEDWGSLRAWAWGASRGLDYLETDKAVDAKRVGIEGVSRYGKAALVTMAFDTRFAVVLVGSSGEGGAKPHRRNFGEAVENLTGSGEYHWMAGNFLKYGASEASFGSRNAGDLPVDSNELIALCAPRLTFISYGIPEKGDAKWLDQQGSFMATVSAQPVFRLLGAKDLGVTEDYRTAKMPPVNSGLLDGQLAWRQHDGGHTDAPNWKYFIPWADKFLDYRPAPWQFPADQPVFRTDANSLVAHSQLLAKAKQGGIDVYFEGDSIVAAVGRNRLPRTAGQLEAKFPWLECGRFRMGRRPDAEHSLASGERGTGRSESQSGRAARGDEQRRQSVTPRGCGQHGGRHHARSGGDRAHHPGESARGDDRRDGHLPQKRQHGPHARHRQDQRQSGPARGWPDGSLSEHQRLNWPAPMESCSRA